jgi:DNA-directed RNA polymerase subunit RPC12/RpoP
MDIIFKCPTCEQELAVDAAGAGTTIECPSCSELVTVPPAETAVENAEPVVETPPAPPPPVEKHFTVPVHAHAPADLIQKPNRPLEVVAKEGDKTIRIKCFRHSDCQESGKNHFETTVSAFLEKVGEANLIGTHPINYSYMELGGKNILTDFGVMIIFKG